MWRVAVVLMGLWSWTTFYLLELLRRLVTMTVAVAMPIAMAVATRKLLLNMGPNFLNKNIRIVDCKGLRPGAGARWDHGFRSRSA